MSQPPIMIIGEGDVARALPQDRCLQLAATAYRATATGGALESSLGHVQAPRGEFHIKGSGLVVDGRLFVAVKVGACYYKRPQTLGLPSIVGLIELFDGETGQPLAVMESGLITKLRTAAGSAVALDHLARRDAGRLLLCGVGEQLLSHATAINAVRQLEQVQVWARRPERADAAAAALHPTMPHLHASAAHDLPTAVRNADLIVGLTPATTPYLSAEDVSPGTTIAAVGSDAPHKQEVETQLLAAAALVCDVTHQCARVGELHHGLAAGTVALADVRAEIGQVVAGVSAGRKSEAEVVVFDSTGTAVQDTAFAAAVYLSLEGRSDQPTFNPWGT